MTSSFGPSGPCHRCGRAGHMARDCTLQTCFRCNGRGHMAWECAEGVTCSRCGEKGHLQRNCKNVACHKCGRKGHISKFCNDPFAKAAEIERMERQHAVLAARARGGPSMGGSGNGFVPRNGESANVRALALGPWDNLGRGQTHREPIGTLGSKKGQQTVVGAGAPGTRGEPGAGQVAGRGESSASGVLASWGGAGVGTTSVREEGTQKLLLSKVVKVVGMKRKAGSISGVEGKEGEKEQEREVRGREERDKEGGGRMDATWQGLMGYGSEDEAAGEEGEVEERGGEGGGGNAPSIDCRGNESQPFIREMDGAHPSSTSRERCAERSGEEADQADQVALANARRGNEVAPSCRHAKCMEGLDADKKGRRQNGEIASVGRVSTQEATLEIENVGRGGEIPRRFHETSLLSTRS